MEMLHRDAKHEGQLITGSTYKDSAIAQDFLKKYDFSDEGRMAHFNINTF